MAAAPLSPSSYTGRPRRNYSSQPPPPLPPPRWPNSLVTLAIETSCDDTAVAVLEKERETDRPEGGSPPARARLLFEERITADNRQFGGIHPLTAAEAHMAAVAPLVARATAALPGAERKPDFVSVTRGPGMLSSLAAGLAVAKGLAVAWGVPLVGVHHMAAHALTGGLAHALGEGPAVGAPYVSLLVSGGHTLLVHTRSATDHRIRAAAANVAVGDLLDKCARAVLPAGAIAAAEAAAGRSLPYGALLEGFANGDGVVLPSWNADYRYPPTRRDEMAPFVHVHAAGGWRLEAPLGQSGRRARRFDFSGLNGAVIKLAASRDDWPVEERRVLARATMQLAFEHLASRLLMVLEDTAEDGVDDTEEEKTPTAVVVAGGVASNGFLRRVLRSALDVRGFQHLPLVAPPPRLCTDNAAMIAWAGMALFEGGWQTDLGVLPVRKWSMDAQAEDGGVLGPGSGYLRRTAS